MQILFLPLWAWVIAGGIILALLIVFSPNIINARKRKKKADSKKSDSRSAGATAKSKMKGFTGGVSSFLSRATSFIGSRPFVFLLTVGIIAWATGLFSGGILEIHWKTLSIFVGAYGVMFFAVEIFRDKAVPLSLFAILIVIVMFRPFEKDEAAALASATKPDVLFVTPIDMNQPGYIVGRRSENFCLLIKDIELDRTETRIKLVWSKGRNSREFPSVGKNTCLKAVSGTNYWVQKSEGIPVSMYKELYHTQTVSTTLIFPALTMEDLEDISKLVFQLHDWKNDEYYMSKLTM